MVSIVASYKLLLVESQSLLVLQDFGHLPDQSIKEDHHEGTGYGSVGMRWYTCEA